MTTPTPTEIFKELEEILTSLETHKEVTDDTLAFELQCFMFLAAAAQRKFGFVPKGFNFRFGRLMKSLSMRQITKDLTGNIN